MFKIDNEIWITVPNNTNITEAAYTLSNCHKSSIVQKVSSNKCQANKLIKKAKTTFSKCKQNENANSNKKKLKKTITIESDIENN
ncbi:hypothetical protein Glove_145g17 [Diversispora epigaea]|uniref:Uncharacterized protein n=1 Tax=Diversispora epigaea TaxID=1348612 RepID=A0A397J3K2_9GLOM|nr:hypothetical protein Glove_145g17 [Diversispora epigaea]